MKSNIFLVLFCISIVCFGLETFSLGQNCSVTTPVFNIISFYASPNPPTNCAAQNVIMIGNFNQNACPGEILITETYNQNTNYNQVNNTLIGCYNPGQNETYKFAIDPMHCISGNYVIQIKLLQQNPSQTLSCWQYQYNL
ncbi:hypothetical protein SteCoe_27103 [Stentor coeruleus]|uniref:MD-2-related lipid-recognition domain-containing protein n=1 Tax=Stentor coeruleus TaxID=5963 RepID=A0A1R2BBR4_9CILI|nr:hypothetical protein SteCoe_27103 [Stentor coeruleus]